MGQHSDYRYSISVASPDLAVVYCLRALSDYSQDTGNTRITWGGTKDSDWRVDNGQVTFHFSRPSYRDDFVATATRLLPSGSWNEVARRDDDPAQPRTPR
jgi:hypothetical protein